MFRSPCLFIVGAGASAEADLPTGLNLRPRIAEILALETDEFGKLIGGDKAVGGVFRHYVRRRQIQNSGQYLKAAWHIRSAIMQAKSIDEFIDNHRGNEQIEFMGKLAITRAILDAERHSKVFISARERFHFLDLCKDTWYTRLWETLIAGRALDDIDNLFDNVSFVIFNYDRCVEQYLHFSIGNYYGVCDDKAGELLNKVKFIHPYGVVGKLPWQQGREQKIEFGGIAQSEEFLDISGQIKTFTEQVADIKALQDLHQTISSAKTIVFLGFAYHEPNMVLLRPEMNCDAKRVFGTIMDISESDLRIVKSHIADMVGGLDDVQLNLSNTNCTGLFKEYSRSISA